MFGDRLRSGWVFAAGKFVDAVIHFCRSCRIWSVVKPALIYYCLMQRYIDALLRAMEGRGFRLWFVHLGNRVRDSVPSARFSTTGLPTLAQQMMAGEMLRDPSCRRPLEICYRAASIPGYEEWSIG